MHLNRNGISNSLVFGDAHVATMLAAPSIPENTVVSQQVALVHALIGTLCDAHPHFVHCIVATSVKCDEFSGSAVLEQVTQMGILESARMYRKGYAEHATHREFVEQYRPLVQSMGLDTSGGNDTAIASALVSALKVESGLWDEILIGKFRVLVKAIASSFLKDKIAPFDRFRKLSLDKVRIFLGIFNRQRGSLMFSRDVVSVIAKQMVLLANRGDSLQ